MTRIYLDVCCLNRPFDDPRRETIRLEAEAGGAEVFLTTDRDIVRRVARLEIKLSLVVANPVSWVLEVLRR